MTHLAQTQTFPFSHPSLLCIWLLLKSFVAISTLVKPCCCNWQVPVFPMLHTSPPATLPKPKPKPPVAPADDIQLPPVGYNRRTPPNGYWTAPPPKYEDIFARRSNPPSSPPRDQVKLVYITSFHFISCFFLFVFLRLPGIFPVDSNFPAVSSSLAASNQKWKFC